MTTTTPIGHARPAVFDVVRKSWWAVGWVTFVQNFTDVDYKIMPASEREISAGAGPTLLPVVPGGHGLPGVEWADIILG